MAAAFIQINADLLTRENPMLRLTAFAFALVASAACAARPMIIRESQALKPPPGAGYTYFGYVNAIDGDWAVLTAGTASSNPADPPNFHDALLYHRVNGQWTLDRTLIHRVAPNNTVWTGFESVGMSNGVAAIGSNPTRLFKLSNGTWTEITHPFSAPPGDPDYVAGPLVWDGSTLLAARNTCDAYQAQPWGALISRINSDGSWSPVEHLSSGDVNCSQTPSEWGISGNTVVTGAWSNDWETYGPDQLHVFRRNGTAWAQTSTIDYGEGEGDVRGDEIFFAADQRNYTRVYRNDDSQTVIDIIGAVDAGTNYGANSYGFRHTSDLFVQHDDFFRKNAAGKYEHVASLVPSGTYYMDGEVSINGRRVISQANYDGNSTNQAVLIFDLPETFTPSAVVETGFESGGTPPFSPQLGTFAVATAANGNHVYRQSSLSGDYRALLGSNSWVEQSIEADIRPTAFSGSDRWAGLAVRYLDSANYYYVTLRSSGQVQLKRLRNGVPELFIQKSMPIVAGHTYRVSLQAYGNGFIVRIDGKEFLYWNEAAQIPHGNVALLGYKTAVDYDNVVAAEVGQKPIVDLTSGCYGPLVSQPAWTLTGTGTWRCDDTADGRLVQQTSTAGDARALIGTATDDQVLTTRARFTSVNGQDRWFGLAARYVDASNYYYLTVRTSNTVSLRKVVNGTVTVLGTASLPVTANTWYDLRLDAVGNELRAFVNGVQLFQAVDSSLASGQGGPLTYKAAAEYLNYSAWQP